MGLNQVTPIPVVVHQLPDFDQDSWTANPPRGTEKATTDSSVIARPSDQSNNNNNNNTLPADSQANQAFDHVCTSDSDSHPTIQLSAPSRTTIAAAEPPASSQTLTLSETAAITNGAGSVTTATASPPLQLSGSAESQTANALAPETLSTNDVAAEAQTANETQSELPSINGEDAQESSSGGQDVVQ